MILSDVFERFSQDSPLSVMAQGIMENALNPQILDQLFEDVAQNQFTNKLLFSTIVDLMSVVVSRIRPSIHAAFQARAETVGATLDAVDDNLGGTPPPPRSSERPRPGAGRSVPRATPATTGSTARGPRSRPRWSMRRPRG